jgi:hypothetical protein
MLVVLLPVISISAQQPVESAPRIRTGRVVQPDTVNVADPFLMTVTIEAPADARVEWPSIDDSTAKVSQRAPVAISDTLINGVKRETARYTLAAWDTGGLVIEMKDALVHTGATTVSVPLSGSRIYVASVLPRDTSMQVPKPAKNLFPRVIPWWERWWPAAVVVVVLLLLWWLLRRRRKVKRTAVASLDIYSRAMHDFARLERLALADSGERGRFVALAVEVLRTYLAARIPQATMSKTSSELVIAVREDTRVPVTRLAPLLGEADAIKFARLPIDAPRARQLGMEARTVVEEIEKAEKARVAAIEAEREQKARDESERKELEEDEARRRSRRGAA